MAASSTCQTGGLDDYERVLLVKQSVYVFKIPPLTSASRGFRAADWNLAQPDWQGRLRLISVGADKLFVKIEDSTTGQLYCQAPVLAYPGPHVQPVVDSRRYFVVKVVSDTGRSALIGIGFADGADSFDLSVALQDYFTTISKAEKAHEEEQEQRPELDLKLKGDIRVNLNIAGLGNNNNNNKASSSSNKPATATLVSNKQPSDPSKPFLLPPPPSSTRRK